MPRENHTRVPLAGIVLPDARSGVDVDLGAVAGVHLLSAIRHRY